MTTSLDRLTAALADRYRIERELGQGGMATVYLAHDLKHDRQVAIKVLRPELGASLGPERFLQEIRVAAMLRHPHILPLFDSGTVGGQADGKSGEAGKASTAQPSNRPIAESPDRPPAEFIFYVMPFVEGETLRTRLARSGPLPVAEVVQLTREIADALAKAHKAGVVHRDIKPENILLADGHAMVMDFGVAKAVSEATGRQGLTSAGMSLGTPAYMAPEQVAADPTIDHRADLYSLGLVAYEMLVGGSPYAATTPQQQMAAHVTQPPAPLLSKRPDCPPALAGLIMRCLAKNPGERWQTADAIVAQLGAVEMTASHGAGRRWAVGAGVVLLLVAVALGARRMASRAGDTSAAGDNSVGVMLFDNITRDTAYAYLADGLASEIATSLARVPRLEVRSPGAVRSAQRGIDPDPREIGRRLNVRNVVEGEFQRGGDKIRIAVRLVSVPSGTQRWNESWTRPMTDLLGVQEEIARAVATAIAGKLLPQEQSVLAIRATTSPEAYDHLLRGNFLLATRTPDGVIRGIAEYRAALRLDSALARAEARIALAYTLFSGWGWEYPGVPPESLIALGSRAADRALALDSTLADGWMARAGMLFYRFPRTMEGAFTAYQRATELEPGNAEAWQQYAAHLMFAGHYDESIVAYRRALALESKRAVTWDDLGLAYDLVHRPADAVAAFDSALAVDAEYYSAYAARSRLRLRSGDRAGARTDAEAARRTSPPGEAQYGLGPMALVTAAEGDTLEARRLMAAAVAPFSRREFGPLNAWLIVPGLVAAGQREQALDWLERATPRGALLWWAMQSPEVDGLRDDPRFRRVIEESRPPGAP